MLKPRQSQYGYRVKCCINSCRASRQANLGRKFFKFPEREKKALLQKWQDACNLKDEIVAKTMYVCEIHFEKDLVMTQKLKKGSIPTLHLDNVSNSADDSNHKTNMCEKDEPAAVLSLAEFAKPIAIAVQQQYPQHQNTSSLQNYSHASYDDNSFIECKPELVSEGIFPDRSADDEFDVASMKTEVDDPDWKDVIPTSTFAVDVPLPEAEVDDPDLRGAIPTSSSAGLHCSKRQKTSDVEETLMKTMLSLQEFLSRSRPTATPRHNDELDEDELFCKSLVMKLKKFPRELKNSAKVEMLEYLSALETDNMD